MAHLQKISIVRYVDADGNRVSKGTPNARKVKDKSDKWYAVWREGGKQVRIPLATDKEVSQVMLADLIRKRERGEADMVNPHKEHLDKPLAEHLDDYLAVVKTTTRSDRHQNETARILNLFVKNGKVPTLKDVNADRVSRYLSRLTSGPTTRNMARRLVVMFLNWLEAVGRIPRNPITAKSVKPAKNGQRRKRRALTAEEVQQLLQAVREYPVRTASVNTGGRNRKDKMPRPARPKPATLAKLEKRGRERWLLYRLAVLTGLRRGELSRLKVHHLEIDRQPFARLNLPEHLTKNGKPARLNLVPSLAVDLRQWIVDTGKQSSDPLLYVPSRCNLAKLHKAHMALASIPYEVDGRYADFHSLRISANTLLRKAGIPAKERQLFLRHGKLELTTETYDDEAATEMADVVRALADANL